MPNEQRRAGEVVGTQGTENEKKIVTADEGYEDDEACMKAVKAKRTAGKDARKKKPAGKMASRKRPAAAKVGFQEIS